MKRKFIRTTMLACGLIVGFAPVARAHDPEGDPGARIEKHMEHAAERLKLSDAQKQQLQPLIEQHVAKAKVIRDKYPAGKTPEQKKQMFEEMRAVRDEYDGQVRAILSEEQQQEWEKMRSERRDRMREHKRERKDQGST